MIDGYIEMVSYDDYVAKYKEFLNMYRMLIHYR